MPEGGYAELHCRFNLSFLHAALIWKLVSRAHEQGYRVLAVTDKCSFAGVVRALTEAPFGSVDDLARRSMLHRMDLQVLAAAGVLGSLAGGTGQINLVVWKRLAEPQGTILLKSWLLGVDGEGAVGGDGTASYRRSVMGLFPSVGQSNCLLAQLSMKTTNSQIK